MRYQVSVTIEASASVIESKMRRGEGTVEVVDGARCLLRTQGDSLEWLAFMLLWFGVDFEVHEPPELVDHIAEVASRLGRSATRRSA
jgi:predicted DNA-binding transcriptional regulator YafY